MLKILHTADVHLGIKFSGLGDKEKCDAQRRQIEDTFKKIISMAVAEKVDVLLIAGDLFDSNQQTQKVIDLVVSQFNLLDKHNIPVCLIPGNHDCLDNTSVFRKMDFVKQCPNLTIFCAEEGNYQELPNLNLTVYGRPNLRDRELISPLCGLKKSTSSAYHIAMAHGSFNIPGITPDDDHVFSAAEIANSGMNYVALGHWHSIGKHSSGSTTAYYSGAPEWLGFGQEGSGKALLVEIMDNGTVEVNVRTSGLRHSDVLELNLGDITNWHDLENRIKSNADTNLARTVFLQGVRNSSLLFSPDSVDQLNDTLSNAFFVLRFADNSVIPIDDISQETYQDKPIIVHFIELSKKRMQMAVNDEERKIIEDALQFGVALLEGRIE